MAGYWPRSFFFFCVFVHKHAKKERGQHAAILTEQAWSIKDLLYGIKHQRMICVLEGQSPYPERVLIIKNVVAQWLVHQTWD